jgi:glycine/D-amino acid oxidase-like deaminating enzyme
VSETFDLGVVGGGIHGGTVALFASRGGMRVALFERGSLCREASGVNAGTLTLQMTRVPLIPYALEAHAMWASAPKWLGHDVGVVVCDGLSLAFTEREAELLTYRARKRREAGAPIEILSGVRAKVAEPGLSEDVLVAGHCAVDGYANAYLTGLAYRRALVEAGVAVREQTPVLAVEPTGGGFLLRTRGGAVRCRRIVLAGGVWIEPMLAWLGVHLPIKVLVNQLAVTERIAPVMRTVIGIASGLLSLKQYPHGTVVIGGGWQGRGDRERGGVELVPEHLVGNVRLACHAVPALASARLARAWAGLEAPFQAFQALTCAAACIRATRAGPTSRDSSPTGSWAASRRCRSSRSSACSPRPSPSEAPHDGSYPPKAPRHPRGDCRADDG